MVSANLHAREIRVTPGAILNIQQAVDSAAPGDTVLVFSGAYGPIYVGPNKAKLKLKGVGAPGSVKVVAGVAFAGILIQADEVIVEGFDVSGSVVGIMVEHSRGVKIAANRVHDCSWAGITLSWCAGAEVARNTVGTGNESAYAEGIGLFTSADVHVHHNQISNAAGCGIAILGSTDCEVDHNTLSHNGNFGIFLNGWPGDGSNNRHHLHHNQANNNAQGGISLYDTPNCLVAYNETDGNRGEGIGLKVDTSPNCKLEQNQANGNDKIGIFMWGSPDCVLDHNEANGNLIFGISAAASCGSRFADNSVHGNTMFDLYDNDKDWGNPSPSCSVYQNNHADTAFPSLAWWNVKSAPRP